jgi:hypothetical protein
LLTDLYWRGRAPFAPVFTLSDILSNIDVTQIEQRERNLKAIEAACRRLGCRPIKRDGAVVRMRLGGSLQQTLWTLTAAHAETLGKEGNEKLGALYRTTREGRVTCAMSPAWTRLILTRSMASSPKGPRRENERAASRQP